MTQQTKQLKTEHKELRNFLEKITIDAGIGRLSQTPNFEEKALAQVMSDLALMTGQKPQLRRAKKSIAGFKIREGQVVGARVTLRRDRMVDFFERLVKIVLPRVRDFQGIARSAVDAGGTLNVGIREQLVFPEINPEQSAISFPLGVNVVPKVKSREKAMEEYKKLGVPMKK
ncbi:MAG: 50S ribosomal protein L5 [Patescibacteria group bacterium]|nr:50S ribosomal protein L5 [Patescibacteria group bacterium]